MSYRRAWLLVQDINAALRAPAVATELGGRHGGSASLTSTGERVVILYRSIERNASVAARRECGTIHSLTRGSH